MFSFANIRLSSGIILVFLFTFCLVILLGMATWHGLRAQGTVPTEFSKLSHDKSAWSAGEPVCINFDASAFILQPTALSSTSGNVAANTADKKNLPPVISGSGWAVLIDNQQIALAQMEDDNCPIQSGDMDDKTPQPHSDFHLSFNMPLASDADNPTGALVRKILGPPGSALQQGAKPLHFKLQENNGNFRPIIFDHNIRVFYGHEVLAGIILVSLFVIGIIWLGVKTAILRDPATKNLSLSRCQAAFWFALTAIGFLYIFLMTGQWLNVVNGQTLTLLGIVSVTSLAGAASAPSPATPAGEVNPSDGSKNWFLQLLSESTETGTAPAVQRLIMLTWTLMLGIIFIFTTLNEYRFPAFDWRLLTLMGLNSGFYAGFKWLIQSKGA